MADRECWQDLQANRLYLICKTTGNAVEVGRDYQEKPHYDNRLTGKASFQERKLTGGDTSVPKLPLYIRRQHSVLRKYGSQSLNNSTSPKRTQPQETKKGRYSVADQLDELEIQTTQHNRQHYLSVQSQNATDLYSRGQSPLQEVDIEDDREIFKLTRYHLSKKYPQSNYHFTANPEDNDYVKPVPLHAHVTVSRKLIEKKMIIEALQKKCMDGLIQKQRRPEQPKLRLFQRKKQQLRKDMLYPGSRFQQDSRPNNIMKSSEIEMGGFLEQKRRARMEQQRRQKLLMERFYLQATELKQKKAFRRQVLRDQ